MRRRLNWWWTRLAFNVVRLYVENREFKARRLAKSYPDPQGRP